MNRYNVGEIEYKKIQILDKKGLFIDLRINFETVPSGLFCYELHNYGSGNPATLEDRVFVDSYGTVILKEPIDFEGEDFIDIEDNINYLCEYIILDDFILF